ncbi:MAG: methyl-accepting chemotaxis protein [Desulfuromonadia bacterium]
MARGLGVGAKIVGANLAVVAIMVLVAIISITRMSSVSSVAEGIAAEQVPMLQHFNSMRNSVDTCRRSELQFYLYNDEASLAKYAERIKKMAEEIASHEGALRKMALTDVEKKGLAEFDSTFADYRKSADRVISLVREKKIAEATALTRGEGKELYDRVNDILADLAQYNQKEVDEGIAAVKGVVSSAKLWVTILILAGIICGVAVGLMVSRAITFPLRRLARDAEQVATGDLNVVVSVDSTDEVGELAESFEKMVGSLREMIATLADSSAQITRASAEMDRNAGDMAGGAEEVASQAITVATASEEMSATSGDIAMNCQMAAESAGRANAAAFEGGEVVQKSIDVMHRIAERVQSSARTVEELGKRSDQIGSIISTIEDIADQTNLLALNAAIEAARAGEQGRGFAVVADEVRALAERTTKATREIGEMIKAIQGETKSAVAAMEEGVAEVEQGTREAAHSEEALHRIQEEINALNLQVQQIATAAEEQTATTSEISGNIHKITTVAQNTVEGARSTARAAQQLAGLSRELERVVSQFRLDRNARFITWNNRFSVGVSEMDREHQRLVELINNLHAGMREGRGREAVGAILGELIDYTKTHFAHEEALMQKAGYEDLPKQKEAHRKLVEQVQATDEKFRRGEALGQEVMNFLKDWLLNHIQGMDRLYGPVMNKKGIR